jgi:hypothetical protein
MGNTLKSVLLSLSFTGLGITEISSDGATGTEAVLSESNDVCRADHADCGPPLKNANRSSIRGSIGRPR